MNSYDRIYTLFIEGRVTPGKIRKQGVPHFIASKSNSGEEDQLGHMTLATQPPPLKHKFNKNRKRSIDRKGVRDEIQARINSRNATGPRTGRNK